VGRVEGMEREVAGKCGESREKDEMKVKVVNTFKGPLFHHSLIPEVLPYPSASIPPPSGPLSTILLSPLPSKMYKLPPLINLPPIHPPTTMYAMAPLLPPDIGKV